LIKVGCKGYCNHGHAENHRSSTSTTTAAISKCPATFEVGFTESALIAALEDTRGGKAEVVVRFEFKGNCVHTVGA